MSKKSDQYSKTIFSCVAPLRQLLEGFVPLPWITRVDFSRAENVCAQFITPGLRRRESDLVWKLPRDQGEELSVFRIVEFQSRPDRRMALRVLGSVAELYLRLSQDPRWKTQKLPAVFPLVLYNGSRRWKAPQRVEDLIQPLLEADFLPKLRYYLLARHKVPRRAGAGAPLVGALFEIETRPAEEVARRSEVLARRLEGQPEEAVLTLLQLFWDDLRGEGLEGRPLLEEIQER